MSEQFLRTEFLIGQDGIVKLRNARVAIFGIGGVGGYVAEALTRCGIGTIDIIDSDTINLSNLNRQIYALHSTLGQYKVDAAKQRMLDINPNITVNTHKTFYLPKTSHLFDFTNYDYIVDAIDTVTGKIELVMKAQEANTPIICSMGTGNKMNPAMLEVSDIYKTSVCPLAKVMRQELKKRKVKKLKVVYSKEIPIKPIQINNTDNKRTPGSTSFVPPTAGLIIASEVIKDILSK